MNKFVAIALFAIVGMGLAGAAPAPQDETLLTADLENDVYVTPSGGIFQESNSEAGLQAAAGSHVEGLDGDGNPIIHSWAADDDLLA